MLHPAVMISDFLESHAFPFVLQFCSRSFLCPIPRRPLQIPNKGPICLLSAQLLSFSAVSNWYQTTPPDSIWNPISLLLSSLTSGNWRILRNQSTNDFDYEWGKLRVEWQRRRRERLRRRRVEQEKTKDRETSRRSRFPTTKVFNPLIFRQTLY
jgi:hypothetical protein